MPSFAVIENENVLNIILVQSKKIAEEITGKTCIEFTTESAEPGGTYVDGIFIKKQPFPSWTLNSVNEWEAPVPQPVFDEQHPKAYSWNEEELKWIEI